MSADSLTLTFSALSDPTRRAILARLARGEATVTDLAAPFDMSLPAISKHLSVLERSGLIERRRESRFRPCRLKPAQLKEATEWMERYRRHWEESLDRLDDYLSELQSKKPGTRQPKTSR
ncbi:MAG: metalloregulator ArsR/SmtB family transcription factor [Planctomycetota bacterium]